MKVRELMKTEVFTVSPNDMVDRVFFLMHFEKIRHLPVVDRRRVVGIISDRDLYKALGPRKRGRGNDAGDRSALHVIPRKVRHLMRRGVITITADEGISKAAAIMARKKIGALPVVTGDERLVGIVTATDLLRALARMTNGASPPSSRS